MNRFLLFTWFSTLGGIFEQEGVCIVGLLLYGRNPMVFSSA